MKISIVTVVFNDVMVGGALESILSQRTDSTVELVVIDGGSTDGTLDILEKYRSRISILVSEPDQGIYDAMNKGLRLATGDVVGTLNADDFYASNTSLAKVENVFLGSDVKACYGDLIYVKKEDPTVPVRYWKSGPFRRGMFQWGWMPPHPTFFVRRELYLKYGYFDPTYRFAGDFELMARFLAKHGEPSIYVPEVLVKMRLGGTTNLNIGNILKGNLECYQACKANGLKGPSRLFLGKLFLRIPQYFHLHMGSAEEIH